VKLNLYLKLVTTSRIFDIFYLHTNLLTTWNRVLLEKLTVSQIDKKFPVFNGTRKVIAAFTGAHHLSLSSVRSLKSIFPKFYFPISILYYAPFYNLALLSGLFPTGSPPKPGIHLSPIRDTCFFHVIFPILSPEYYSVRCTDHYAAHYVSLYRFKHK